MSEGFIWSCCGKEGDDKGCKITKHRAKVNMIVKVGTAAAAKGVQKRKAGDAGSHNTNTKRRNR